MTRPLAATKSETAEGAASEAKQAHNEIATRRCRAARDAAKRGDSKQVNG